MLQVCVCSPGRSCSPRAVSHMYAQQHDVRAAIWRFFKCVCLSLLCQARDRIKSTDFILFIFLARGSATLFSAAFCGQHAAFSMHVAGPHAIAASSSSSSSSSRSCSFFFFFFFRCMSVRVNALSCLLVFMRCSVDLVVMPHSATS